MRIRYFAWVREKVGFPEEEIDRPSEVTTVAELITWLKARSDSHANAFEEADTIRVALDQIHAEHDELIGDTREVAFFPPMTGG